MAAFFLRERREGRKRREGGGGGTGERRNGGSKIGAEMLFRSLKLSVAATPCVGKNTAELRPVASWRRPERRGIVGKTVCLGEGRDGSWARKAPGSGKRLARNAFCRGKLRSRGIRSIRRQNARFCKTPGSAKRSIRKNARGEAAAKPGKLLKPRRGIAPGEMGDAAKLRLGRSGDARTEGAGRRRWAVFRPSATRWAAIRKARAARRGRRRRRPKFLGRRRR